jgi:hypothetical protein
VSLAGVLGALSPAPKIIRRRLFEWHGLPEDGRKTAAAYDGWVLEHRHLVGDFDTNTARERFLACYPFHPALLSVFARKWQSLPRFQKTRGVLRLLALWVSRAYVEGYRGAQKDPLIGLGTAPLEDSYFRAALFEQLGNSDLEAVVTTDIAGKNDAHALRLDRAASDAVKRARLHQRVATAILFESNGGQTRAEATVPEIRLAVAEPGLDVAMAIAIGSASAPTSTSYSSTGAPASSPRPSRNGSRGRFRLSSRPGPEAYGTAPAGTCGAEPGERAAPSGRRDHVGRLVLRPEQPELPLPGRFMVGPGRGDRPGRPVRR